MFGSISNLDNQSESKYIIEIDIKWFVHFIVYADKFFVTRTHIGSKNLQRTLFPDTRLE